MTGDYKEKYLRINLDFPPLAGRLDQLIQAQKRLIKRMASQKNLGEDCKALVISVAHSVEETEKLIEFTHKYLQGVAEDAKALTEGAEIRNTIKWQGQLINEFIDVTSGTNKKTA
jgi:DNA helicase IV